MFRLLVKWLQIAVVVGMHLMLVGCWDVNEPERQIYVHGMGIDYKDDKYTVYLQIINLSLLAKTESSGGEKDIKIELGHAEGLTVEEAIFNLYKSTQRRLFWGHLSYIIFTEDLIQKETLVPIIDFLDRFTEAHYRVWMFLTKDPLENILRCTPILGMSTDLSKISDPSSTYEQNSFIPSIDLRQMVIQADEPPFEIHIPYLKLAENQWETDKEKKTSISMNGIAVLEKNKFKGVIEGTDVNGYRWINTSFKRGQIQSKEKKGKKMSVLINDLSTNVKPIQTGSKVQFDIELIAEGRISHIEKEDSPNEISREVEESIKEEIRKTYLRGLDLDSDVFKFSTVIYRENNSVWKHFNQNGKIPLDKDSIRKMSVNVKLKDGGKQLNIPVFE